MATLAVESPNGEYLFYVETATGSGSGPMWQLALKTPGGKAVKVMENVPSTSFDVIDSGVYYVDQSAGDTRLQFLQVCDPEFDHCGFEAGQGRWDYQCQPGWSHDLFYADRFSD